MVNDDPKIKAKVKRKKKERKERVRTKKREKKEKGKKQTGGFPVILTVKARWSKN